MCGITGIYNHSAALKDSSLPQLKGAVNSLHHRGPDNSGYFESRHCLLGHTRLSIIDTSAASAQPFFSPDKRYVLVYNGEIFNYRELRDGLEKKGISLKTSGDTEVLLQLYIHEGEKALEKLNGFFALSIYDTLENTIFIARDRYGMKPLFYSISEGIFYFASEMKALMNYPVKRQIDQISLLQYLQLNYVPAPNTMIEGIKKFPAGHYAKLSTGSKDIVFHSYCREPYLAEEQGITYSDAKERYFNLLSDAVQKRLIADVPLGTFLSGGLDSSAVTAIASLHKPDLMTFSIGYKNEPMFDESRYAEMVSRKLNTRHQTFMLDNVDLYNDLFKVLDALDEPFGDSSAIPMHILSMKTRQHVKVALSGDGGDELLGGYNKHLAEIKFRQRPWLKPLALAAKPIFDLLPQGRNSPLANFVRKAGKFSEGASLNVKDRYWRWASIATLEQARMILKDKEIDANQESGRKNDLLKYLNNDFNSLLYTDVKMVLQNDMLVKTDLMSMANSLEVRMPLLDYRLVEFCFSLPVEHKITASDQKKILRESVEHLLPPEILQREKHGFEVPLLKWFKTELRSSIESDWLSDDYILNQGIFDGAEISKLKQQLYSGNPQDAVARVWGLIAFQHWYRKHIE